VGLSLFHREEPWQALLTAALEAKAQQYPEIQLVVRDAGGDEWQQAEDVQTLLREEGIQALLLVPEPSPSLKEAIEEAESRHVPVLTLHRRLPDAPVACHLSVPPAEEGRAAMRFLQERGEKGRVAEILDPEDPFASERSQGFHAALGEASGWQVVYQDFASAEEAQMVVEDALRAFPDLKAFFVHRDETAVTIAETLSSAGRNEEVWVLGVGHRKEAVASVWEGKMKALVASPWGATEAWETVLQILHGQPCPQEIALTPRLLTAQNVTDWMKEQWPWLRQLQPDLPRWEDIPDEEKGTLYRQHALF
jgi:ribose transport system substrate-binding protein